MGGKFILRVEDTDRERNTADSMAAIFESMRWLGLDYDEGPEVGGDYGPYLQSERFEIYREYAERMVRLGTAYRCYCTRAELTAMRDAHNQRNPKEPWRYPGTWRDRTDWPADQPYVIRLKAPREGFTAWNDLVKGSIQVPNSAQQDVVLLREDGVPLYNFSAAVDDALMQINLVARGDDHVVNTPIQILIYQALGFALPQFAHVPMILAPSGEKLSKRHAAVSVLEYRDLGYVPDGVLNYLARLGWSHGDQEIFTRQELIDKFSWDHVGSTGARYDLKKFAHVQGSHLRMLSDEELLMGAQPFFEKLGILPTDLTSGKALTAVSTVRTRTTTLADVADMSAFYFREPQMDEAAVRAHLTPEKAVLLEKLAHTLQNVDPFTKEPLEAAVQSMLEQGGHKLKDVAQPARVALTGRTQSPGLFEMAEVLGKATVKRRLELALALARQS